MDFRVDLEPDGNRLTLLVRGEIDDCTGRQLGALVDDALAAHASGTLVLDLAGVVFMDSRGLGELLGACRAVERAGRRAYVANASIHAERVLDTAGLGSRLREA